MSARAPNKLISEKSIYLRQHAFNPIDWFPWSEEAFKIAKEKDCPVFLSIGYSSCHWCHVMEKESFEDEEVARILNENFISIKVDREELPDVDNFYMTFVTATTGSGGWPLSVFLLPDKTPFYGGTYFPPEPKFGKPSFKNLLTSIIDTYKNRRNDLEKLKIEVNEFLIKNFTQSIQSDEINFERIKDAYQIIVNSYDWTNGGWGKGAKFPMFPILNFLIDYSLAFGDALASRIVEHNLKQIMTGGIYDHISGGVHRYTVDNKWIVPHYEKMLYDNAQLIEVISKFLLIEENEFLKTKLYETFNFLLTELKSKEGGYLTAIDADSEGEEGKFYLWNFDELVNAINEKFDKDLFFEFYQFNLIEKEKFMGNLSMRKIPDFKNTIVLNALEIIKHNLNHIRKSRTKPEKDNKILTDLNALLISALTFAYRATEDDKFLDEAISIGNFIENKLIIENEVFHSYVEGEARVNGFSDDYFLLVQALSNLYEVTFEEKYLIKSFELLNRSINLFYDLENKVIHQQQENTYLPFRTSEIKDYSKPSSNSVAISLLLKLGKIFEEQKFNDIALDLLKKYFDEMVEYPFGGGKFLSAALEMIIPPREMILVEGESNEQLNKFKSILIKKYFPNQLIFFKEKDSSFNFSYLEGKKSIDKKLTVYICENFSCQKPVNNPSDLSQII